MFEQWLHANGFDPLTLGDKQTAKLKSMWQAETQTAPAAIPVTQAVNPPAPAVTVSVPADSSTFDQTMLAIEAETSRRNYILGAGAKAAEGNIGNEEKIRQIKELTQAAVADKGMDRMKFDLALLRLDRMAGPIVFARTEPEASDKVIEAAICMAGGLSNIGKHFDERTLDTVHKRFRNGLGLADLVMTFARRGGYQGHSLRANLEGALRAAFAPQGGDGGALMAGSWGPSTGGGIAGILSNTANKFLTDGFNAVDMSWREFSARRSVSDFKQISTYSLTGDLDYEKLPPGGEIKHGQLGSETYVNQADTYAKMLGLDRRDLINDDLGALTTVARRLGRGAATRFNKVFWALFLNNSAVFTAGRNNVSTGAGSALSLAGLDAANQKFTLQTDPNGNPMAIMPRILLVPPALEATAATLMASTMMVSGATTTPGTPSTNIWANRFRVVSSPYMQDSTLTGNSAAAWYLIASPDDVPLIEVVFLNGRETPVVESADADFAMLGIAFRGYHDFGVAYQEYRAAVRSAGS